MNRKRKDPKLVFNLFAQKEASKLLTRMSYKYPDNSEPWSTQAVASMCEAIEINMNLFEGNITPEQAQKQLSELLRQMDDSVLIS